MRDAVAATILFVGASVSACDGPADPRSAAIAAALAVSTAEAQARLRADRIDVDAVDENGLTRLHWCSEAGDLAQCGLLIRAGAEIDRRDETGRTPLHYAAGRGSLQAVELLIISGANVRTPDNKGTTPLLSAAFQGSSEIVALLLNHGADPNAGGPSTPLDAAFSSLHAGITVESEMPETTRRQLRRARERASIARAKLWEMGVADPDPRGLAASIRLLLGAGANPDRAVKPLLYYAASNADVENVRLLLDAGANPDHPFLDDRDGRTYPPLWAAISANSLEVTELLLSHGANANWVGKRGLTLLHSAVLSPAREIAGALARHGASLDAKTADGFSAMDLAEVSEDRTLAGFVRRERELGIRKDSVVASSSERALEAVVVVESTSGQGSGFVASAGLVVSNAHVVGVSEQVTVRYQDGEATVGLVILRDATRDLALISVSPNEVSPIGVATEAGRVGDEVYSLGAPLGLDATITKGIISAIRTADGVEYLQTDAAMSPGSSGGPLISARTGRVVGVNVLKIVAAGAEGLSFAVSSRELRAVLRGLSGQREVGATKLASKAKSRH
jgi:ankyrin repeat protein